MARNQRKAGRRDRKTQIHGAAFQLPEEAEQGLFLGGEVDVHLSRGSQLPWVQLSQGALRAAMTGRNE